MHKILTKTGQISDDHFRSTNCLPTSKVAYLLPELNKQRINEMTVSL